MSFRSLLKNLPERSLVSVLNKAWIAIVVEVNNIKQQGEREFLHQ